MSEQNLEEKIGAVLNDPQQMQQIFALAQALGLSAPSSAPPPAPAQQAPPKAPPEPPMPQAAPVQPPTGSVSDTLAELLQKAGTLDRRQENLLNALKPFLRPDRREKIDRAMQAARLSRLAGAALRGRDQTSH